jgi:hypothetical protein
LQALYPYCSRKSRGEVVPTPVSKNVAKRKERVPRGKRGRVGIALKYSKYRV